MAGSLSAAVEAGLQLYVDQQRLGTSSRQIEVLVGRGRSRVVKRFRGRDIDEFELGVRADGSGMA